MAVAGLWGVTVAVRVTASPKFWVLLEVLAVVVELALVTVKLVLVLLAELNVAFPANE